MNKNSSINFTSFFNIGGLNEKKINAVLNSLPPNKYHNANINSSNFISITNNTKSHEIQISPNQILINRNGFNDFIEEIKDIKNDISIIIDSLMLEDITSNAIINLTSIIDVNLDTYEFTKNLYPNIFKTDLDKNDYKGIGFRLLSEGKNGLFNEFKVEPYINNSNYLFIQGIYNYIDLNCKSMDILIKDNYTDYYERLNAILNDIKS